MDFAHAGNRISVLLAASLLLFAAATRSAAAPPTELSEEDRRRFADAQLMFCFQGKGSCLPYDAGVLHEAYAPLPALRENRVIIAGNSSGSIAAAYFACFGFSDATVKHAVNRLTEGNRDAGAGTWRTRIQIVEVDPPHFHGNLARTPPRIHRLCIRRRALERCEVAEIVFRSTAKPRHPIIIVSCNKEVLEDADATDGRASSAYKEFDLDALAASSRAGSSRILSGTSRAICDRPPRPRSIGRSSDRPRRHLLPVRSHDVRTPQRIPPEERQGADSD